MNRREELARTRRAERDRQTLEKKQPGVEITEVSIVRVHLLLAGGYAVGGHRRFDEGNADYLTHAFVEGSHKSVCGKIHSDKAHDQTQLLLTCERCASKVGGHPITNDFPDVLSQREQRAKGLIPNRGPGPEVGGRPRGSRIDWRFIGQSTTKIAFVTKEPDGLYYLWQERHGEKPIPADPYERKSSAIDALNVVAGHTHRPNASHYVWVLPPRSDTPLSEGPYGPMSLARASQMARIAATEGVHDRAVSVGSDPESSSFAIARRYAARTGARLI
jgi:hypothetical protein